ncbi:MAG: 4Fe-4S iron sulfur cluster binding s, NifH/frxC family protein [Schlesneria sp.]|nr:4Fe-4S iron sulfur cluster binding s, NifH/frxC family protein [Schlesneria sp.]
MTRRIAWLNEKGGSGKSTSALNLSANLASRFGQRVLLIDVDHQANITAVLTHGQTAKKTLTDVFLSDVPVEQAIFKTRILNLDLLPADSALADVNVAMADTGNRLGLGRELRLKRALAPIEKNYDFVIVDTGPQRTLLNINVLNYVDEVFVPIDPGYWSIMGVQHLEKLVEQIRLHMEHDTLHIGGVLLTKVQKTNVAREVEQQVREYFGEQVFRTAIPLNVKVEEAHSRGISVLDYSPDSAGAVAYLEFTKEVLFHAADTENRLG